MNERLNGLNSNIVRPYSIVIHFASCIGSVCNVFHIQRKELLRAHKSILIRRKLFVNGDGDGVSAGTATNQKILIQSEIFFCVLFVRNEH